MSGSGAAAHGAQGRAEALVAGGALVLAFAMAELTGVRAVGGAVLIAAGAWILRRPRGWAIAAVMAGCFVASHGAAAATGAWPAVLLAAGVAGASAHRLAKGAPPRPRSGDQR